MSHYYDYHMSTVLDQPIGLIGFFGCEAAQVGYHIASLTGLPFASVDRLVEHSMGCSVAELTASRGIKAYRERLKACLDTELISPPFGILALPPDALMGADAGTRTGTMTLVYLRMDLFDAYRALRRQLRADPKRYLPHLAEPPQRPADLAQALRERETGFGSAQLICDVKGRHPAAVAQQIIETLALM